MREKSKRSWLKATIWENSTDFHYFIDTFGAISMTNQETRTQIILDIDRKLSPDSYKWIYIIHTSCRQNVDMLISNKDFLKQAINKPNTWKNRILKHIAKAKHSLFGYKYDKKHELKTKYHILMKLAYISWIFNILMCVIIPLFMYDKDCKQGLSWPAHGLFGSYLITSFILEIIFFYWLTDAWSQKLSNNLNKWEKFWYKAIRIYYILAYAFQSLISKGAEYTSIAFMVEIMKCYNQDEKPILLYLFVFSLATFFLTLLFPFIIRLYPFWSILRLKPSIL